MTTGKLFIAALCASGMPLCLGMARDTPAAAPQTQQGPSAAATSRYIGAIKSINGTVITLAPDSGPEVKVTVPATSRIVRIAPGEKDLKNATPIQLQDLQVNDRVLVGGKASVDNDSLEASTVVVMKRSDVEARQQQELQDWQKRGLDGLATSVDATAGTVTISVRNKPVTIHVGRSTVIRRYAPDSVKFDDAKPSALAEIHSGDQVRARGERSADSSELTADEIVSGTFRNIAGTVNSVDASSSTLNVHDLLSKKNETLRITQDSQLRQLPPEMAQRFAARLKRTGAAAAPGAGGDAPNNRQSSAGVATGASPGGAAGAENGMARRPGGAADLQQMITRLPAATLSDLHKGDAVIILSTEGTAGVGTAITLLTGVEPILRAAPNASGASILTPWSLSAPSGDAGGP